MVGPRHGRRGGAMMPSYNLARMSGMLDLSKDEKAKHFLPRWLRDARGRLGALRVCLRQIFPPKRKRFCGAFTWMRVDLSMMRKRSWNLMDSLTVSVLPYCALNCNLP